MIVSLFVSFLIFVKFDVEDFPLADADAGVTALVSLVAVMATQVLHGAIVSNSDLINGENAKALAPNPLVRLLACIPTCFGETILA